MFVYIWKHNNIPFYIGMTKNFGRTNPLNSGGRGWLCKQMLDRVGRASVTVEVRAIDNLEDAQKLERALIAEYGRIQLGTGPLTNLKPGGDGGHGMSAEGRAATSARMKANNPLHNPETRAKIKARMADPKVRALFTGDKNPTKRPEVRAKLKAVWADPEYRKARIQERIGRPIHDEENKQRQRERLLDPSNPMREYHKTLNTDKEIHKKRVVALQSEEVRARISEKLKERWSKESPEEREKRLRGARAPKTPETKARISAAKKEWWAKRKASMG